MFSSVCICTVLFVPYQPSNSCSAHFLKKKIGYNIKVFAKYCMLGGQS